MKKVIAVVILALMALAGWSIWDSLQDKPFHEEAAGGAAQGESAAHSGSGAAGWASVHGDLVRQGVDLEGIPEYKGEPALAVICDNHKLGNVPRNIVPRLLPYVRNDQVVITNIDIDSFIPEDKDSEVYYATVEVEYED